ncbi:hypothetical protein [Comamonas faecalis]
MQDDSQIHIPPSFIALYTRASGRLGIAREALLQRYELCEDLACQLVEQAQQLYQTHTPSEERVLRQIHAGLASAESGLDASEARWVMLRLAELLQWRSPDLGGDGDGQD